MELELGFPSSRAVEEDLIPDGYPLVCPGCGQIFYKVVWDGLIRKFVFDSEPIMTIYSEDILDIFSVRSTEHCRISKLEPLHLCELH
jgi:hypothetical protein